MNKCKKKPVVVEAVQWDGSALGATPIINWILENGGVVAHPYQYLMITTLEGRMQGLTGDWIIKGVKGGV